MPMDGKPAFCQTEADYRAYILPKDEDRLTHGRGLDVEAYSRPILQTQRAIELKATWDALLAKPYLGITENGTVEPGLFALEDEDFDPAPAVSAAYAMLSTMSEEEQSHVLKPLDALEWRAWYNPEILFNNNGVRLENLSQATRDCFLDLLSASTSPAGFQKIRHLMKANLFLGELYDLTNIMNVWSYHFQIFGTPSLTEPWGWHFYGHHVGFNVLILGRQMVISPTFMGTEPNDIQLKSGEHFSLFKQEEALGLALMQSLCEDLKARATLYRDMEDPSMPAWRFNFADQRHLGGAFQDNRIVPLEGVCAAEFTPAQQEALLELIECFYAHWPDGPRRARMRAVKQHMARTWWSWIGGHGNDDPFYFHIHSPVIMLEFDHHSGMWLSNEKPAKFHIHVISRIPNGNDYGKALIALHAEKNRKAAPQISGHDQ